MRQETNTTRNLSFTPHAPRCRICHYSGYSNNCDFFSTGKCPLMTAVKEVRRIKVI